MSFTPPTPAERLRAIGPLEGLPPTLRKALEPGADFEPIPAPGPHDWLASHPEPGQTFDDFVRSNPNRPDKTRAKLYLQPLGEFPAKQSPPLEKLREYAAAYFSMDCQTLPSLALTGARVTARINPFTHRRQILTGDALAILQKNLPADAFCVLAITMEDLYPDPAWNFVFGQASPRERVGVYSFARYDPAFYGEKRGADYESLLLRRSGKVLVHETGHMFGLEHCIFFRCVLNGSNHLAESDSRPLHLCPVCLRKLQYSVGFDVASRYRSLLRFYRGVGFDDEAQWIANRLQAIAESGAGRDVLDQEPAK